MYGRKFQFCSYLPKFMCQKCETKQLQLYELKENSPFI